MKRKSVVLEEDEATPWSSQSGQHLHMDLNPTSTKKGMTLANNFFSFIQVSISQHETAGMGLVVIKNCENTILF